VGGYFVSELKFAGYDFVIFKGRAARPVYLWIHNDKIKGKAKMTKHYQDYCAWAYDSLGYCYLLLRKA
jgi:aldehyde:ferredoxin oxidoreductase